MRRAAASAEVSRELGRDAQVDSAASFEEKKEALKMSWGRDYKNFFRPWEKQFYADDVSFQDPLVSVRGKRLYQMNMDLLNGNNYLGEFVLGDAFVDLHAVEDVPEDDFKLRTRWTGGFTVNILPWKPRVLFSGISEYTIDSNAQVLTQRDYWDSVNLVDGGSYSPEAFLSGVFDMAEQVLPSFLRRTGEPEAARSGAWTLLRKAPKYHVYRNTADGRVFAIGDPKASIGLSDLSAALRGHGLAPGSTIRAQLSAGGEVVVADAAAAKGASMAATLPDTVLGVELLGPHPWQRQAPMAS